MGRRGRKFSLAFLKTIPILVGHYKKSLLFGHTGVSLVSSTFFLCIFRPGTAQIPRCFPRVVICIQAY